MVKIAGVIVAAVMLATDPGRGVTARTAELLSLKASHPSSLETQAPLDVSALLTQARGAPPLICSLAAQALRNWGWSDSDAPVTPIASSATLRQYDWNDKLSDADQNRLLDALSTDDGCVREISVRLLAQQRTDLVLNGLLSRLTSSDASLREVSTLGLGLFQNRKSVDRNRVAGAVMRNLRDQSAAVRANSAWALGRLEAGQALESIRGLFTDNDERVRVAAVAAAGHMDSTTSVPALIRVVRTDSSPDVRRVAAWALGQLESRDAIDALTGVLKQDSDHRVREMAAWALGEMEARSATSVLASAARGDDDDRVRETATWALGQLGDRTQVDLLGNIAGSDRSPRVRGTAAWAIGQLRGNGKAPEGLVRMLRDDSDDARLKAAWALGQIGDPSATEAIKDALNKETNTEVRRALIRALMKAGGRSEATLTQLLQSSDPTVREAAVRGLVGNNAFNPWPWPWPRPRPFP